MAKDTLKDLHDILFAQLETLSDLDLKGDELKAEITRSQAMSQIGGTIVKNAAVIIQGVKVNSETGLKIVPKIVTGQKAAFELEDKSASF